MQHCSPIPHDLEILHHPHMRLVLDADRLCNLQVLLCLLPPLLIQLVKIRKGGVPARYLMLRIENVL
jgi:hypothetical protein